MRLAGSRELELTEVRSLERESRPRGALDGLLIGFASGAVLGAVLALATYDSDSYIVNNRGEAVLLGIGFYGGIGGAVGAAGGYVGGATMEYQLPAQR